MRAETIRLRISVYFTPLDRRRIGYDAGMSEQSNESQDQDTPDVGLIPDEDLPEDLQPTDDNPLAQDPSESEDDEGGDNPSGEKKVEGMPDMGEPGAPA